jgi:leucyl aminopeptidase
MPLEEEYADALKDKFADLKNTGSDAGAIAAALFLQEFVPKDTAWAHWDIAGTAFVNKAWKYTEYGATGFGVQTLIELARRMSKADEESIENDAVVSEDEYKVC